MNLANLNPFGSIYGILGILVAIAVILIVIYFIMKNRKKDEGEKKEINAIDSDVKELQTKGVKATLSASQVTAGANQISNALSKAGYNKSDAFSEVFRVILKLKNDADLLNLRKVYGIREIYNGFGNPKDNPKLTLNESIYLFTPKEVGLINIQLAKQGVKASF